ncbi:uncharacterized protein F5147DRAFT_677841 [Suillus discolor]|uniref:Uncharacterized protein n=1 Tax=Suillus discolor TaxID=1912936 RepID=A0A9P7FDD4_9AGAM|nr:uncharacterized protein F5147DRAFT_677841 [Suillus discolor]KAG2114757.1 hypothetical protein F5147DRAFT_677841 [Suillus discolor]
MSTFKILFARLVSLRTNHAFLLRRRRLLPSISLCFNVVSRLQSVQSLGYRCAGGLSMSTSRRSLLTWSMCQLFLESGCFSLLHGP